MGGRDRGIAKGEKESGEKSKDHVETSAWKVVLGGIIGWIGWMEYTLYQTGLFSLN